MLVHELTSAIRKLGRTTFTSVVTSIRTNVACHVVSLSESEGRCRFQCRARCGSAVLEARGGVQRRVFQAPLFLPHGNDPGEFRRHKARPQ